MISGHYKQRVIQFGRMVGRTSFLHFVLKRNSPMSCARQNSPWKIISAAPWKNYRFQADDGTGGCSMRALPPGTGAFTFPILGSKQKLTESRSLAASLCGAPRQ